MDDFARHLRQAIGVNRALLPVYAQASGGQSRALSAALIRSEWFALPVAFAFDLWGNRWQARGVPVLAAEFQDMILPPLPLRFPEGVDHTAPKRAFDPGPHRRAILGGVRAGDADAVMTAAGAALAELADQPHLWRMTRHLCESIRRFAGLWPLHNARARTLGLRGDPGRLSRAMIRLQAWSLSRAARYDRRCAPVQIAGVPFLFHDLPELAPLRPGDYPAL